MSAALGALRGKTKPFPTLIISAVMGQSEAEVQSLVDDVTLQDCGRVASSALLWSECGEWFILRLRRWRKKGSFEMTTHYLCKMKKVQYYVIYSIDITAGVSFNRAFFPQ